MAQPIPFHSKPGEAASQLQRLRARIDAAPEEHAAAVLAAFDLLQTLHERGILDLCQRALAAGDELLDSAVTAANTPEAIRALRNLLFWRGVLGRIDPERFQEIFRAIPDALAVAASQRNQRVSLWTVLRRALSRDSLRGLTAGIDFLESFGRHLHSLERASRKREA